MRFKRAMLTEPRKFKLFEVDEKVGDGQVMIQIASCGLCNWELNFWRGDLNFQGYPHKLGHEFSGVVVAVGKGCAKLKVGDKVSAVDRGFGGFAEYRVTPEEACEKLAADIDPKYALGEPQKCVLTVLSAVAPRAADYGVILGCGPMGIWCVQALAGNFLGALIGVDIDDGKLNMAKNSGATHTINSKSADVSAVIREITDGHMADFVIEGTGVPALLNEAQDYLKAGRGSRIVLMSSHHAAAPDFDFRKAVARGLTIIAAHPPYSENEREDFRRAVLYINNGTFQNKPLVTHEFSLAEIQRAFEMLENKPAGFLKGIVVP
jgi:threonine dehydrogenase-like Zn-dependent dehydrogenase